MKAALRHVKHVLKNASPAQTNAKDNPALSNANVYVGNALMPAKNVQLSAEIKAVTLHNQPNNVPMPAVHVQKNAKSMTMSSVSVVQMNAESAKQNV